MFHFNVGDLFIFRIRENGRPSWRQNQSSSGVIVSIRHKLVQIDNAVESADGFHSLLSIFSSKTIEKEDLEYDKTFWLIIKLDSYIG